MCLENFKLLRQIKRGKKTDFFFKKHWRYLEGRSLCLFAQCTEKHSYAKVRKDDKSFHMTDRICEGVAKTADIRIGSTLLASKNELQTVFHSQRPIQLS